MEGKSLNSTNHTSFQDLSAYDNAAAVLYTIMFVFIVPLNIVVIVNLIQSGTRKSRLHFFILHLAIADLSVGFVNVLGDGIQSYLYGSWYAGDAVCRIWRYLKSVNTIVSNNLLIGLGVDRFLAVAFPMMVMKKGSILYKALVAFCWVLGFVVSIFFLIFSEGVNGKSPDGGCFIKLPKDWWKIYFGTVMAFVYVLPTIIVTLCHLGIIIVVWQKWRENLSLSELSRPGQSGEKRPGESKKSFFSKAKAKSVKMTLVICLAFFLCWTPYFVASVMSLLDHYVSSGSYTILGALYCLNSVCNPLIFMLFNLDRFVPASLCRKQNYTDTTEELVTLESNE